MSPSEGRRGVDVARFSARIRVSRTPSAAAAKSPPLSRGERQSEAHLHNAISSGTVVNKRPS